MSGAQEPVGTLDVALSHATRLLRTQPTLAAEQADEILKVSPGHPVATLLKGAAQRLCGEAATAITILEPLARANPTWPGAQHELGLAYGAGGEREAAIAALRRAVQLDPTLADAWRELADHLDAAGDAAEADHARARFIKAANRDPRLMAAGAALVANRLAEAEALLRAHLKQHADRRRGASACWPRSRRGCGRYEDAETLLARCLELAPSFSAARHNYAIVLHRQNKPAEALPQVERLLAARAAQSRLPQPARPRSSRSLGEYAESIELYAGGARGVSRSQPKVWMSYGHALKTAGRQRREHRRLPARASRSRRRSARPTGASPTSRPSASPPPTSRRCARSSRAPTSTAEDRLHFQFALGKALEDAGELRGVLRALRGGQPRCAGADAATTPTRRPRTCAARKALFTREFFAARAGAGAPAPDPIFIVGLPRAGSTLIEQILASHSPVEGTMELPDIARDRARPGRPASAATSEPRYPRGRWRRSTPEKFRALGRAVPRADARPAQDRRRRSSSTRCRTTSLHVGLIHLILPNAKIIDARRHPLGCCFSGFKQHFARGQNFTYGLDDIGRYYRDYVELMAHFDAVLPGRVHRVHLRADGRRHRGARCAGCSTTAACRSRTRCLQFYENERAVRTASSEQVRQPIFREGVDHWRTTSRGSGRCKAALGPVLERYPAVPDFAELHSAAVTIR